MKIISFYKQRLKHASHIKLMQKFGARLQGVTLNHGDAVAKRNAFSAAINKEAADYKKATGSTITEQIAEADAKRDKAYASIAKVVAALADAGSTEQKAEARKMQLIIDNYNVKTTAQYDQESGMLDQLIADVEAQGINLALLALTATFADLKTANAQVDSLLDSRDYEQKSTKTGVMKEDRQATDAAYDALIEFINALLLLQPTNELIVFAEYWNATLNRVRLQILGGSSAQVDIDDAVVDDPETPTPTPDPEPEDEDDRAV